jgi:2-methylisocitrate lyase-like PEP mutase family enzyme
MVAGLTGAALLRSLHRPGAPLVLPNAWDLRSAQAVEAAGFPVVATSSSAVAEEHGRSDGELDAGTMLGAVAGIARGVRVPVTADLEAGYGLTPAELVAAIKAAGAVGCNLEDTDPSTGRQVGIDEQCAMLAALRAAADKVGLDLVLNARIDTFLHGAGSATAQLADAIRRARGYLVAGADCVFPILLDDAAAIRALVDRVQGPVNTLAHAGGPSIDELTRTGVARISLGGALRDLGPDRLPTALAAIKAGAFPS